MSVLMVATRRLVDKARLAELVDTGSLFAELGSGWARREAIA